MTIDLLGNSNSNANQNPIDIFLYAIKAPGTRQYISELKAFFDFTGVRVTLEEESALFVQKPDNIRSSGDGINGTTNNKDYQILASIMHFMNYQKESLKETYYRSHITKLL